MSKPLRAEPEAIDELRAGAQRYEERRAQLGADFLEAGKAAAARIAQVPTIGSLVPDVPPELGVRQVFLGRFPYAVVFIELPNEVRILAFAHTSREPGYWKKRLPP